MLAAGVQSCASSDGAAGCQPARYFPWFPKVAAEGYPSYLESDNNQKRFDSIQTERCVHRGNSFSTGGSPGGLEEDR